MGDHKNKFKVVLGTRRVSIKTSLEAF
ncbi:uncharacterized protein G2W53_028431 [Senna tora]|uniref:Uncharacterized protein n=1 Tax=Senna tora TaxID=362788 RepID=A0A834W9Q9_9FABA|nr:uncharacterized protein G2W53_028431 [Senna tora]